jgi:hypothetical protein
VRADEEPTPSAPISAAERRALDERNLREFNWLALEGVRAELGYSRGGSVIASLIRTLIAQGEDHMDLKEASEIAVVNGLMVHGVPPRTEREWEIARRIFEPDVVRHLEGWPAFEGFLKPAEEGG